ncbi:MAG: Uma2 family endonuclease [Ignavibacteria bacterium]|jgi:Uma2 family endonuclease|nr:Uma2 family endonuclease [Ignavibacteria bacterium]
MSELVLDLTQRYTYADYLTWLDDKRRELIDGVISFISKMSPAPNLFHAGISWNIVHKLGSYIKKHKGNCKIFYAPFDVRFVERDNVTDKDIRTVVQPDILIVCDPSKLDKRGCIGAPDFIAEIVSPSNSYYDTRVKYELYQRYKVKEYWIVYPDSKSVEVNILQEDGKYATPVVFVEVGDVPVATLPGLSISMDEVFEE